MSNVIAMKQLLEAGVHFGHQTRRWNPKMAEYIFTERNGIYIIDLQKTVKKVEEAKTVEDLRDVVFAEIKAEIEGKGLETAKKELFEYAKVVPNSLEEAGQEIIGDSFDAAKKEFKLEINIKMRNYY